LPVACAHVKAAASLADEAGVRRYPQDRREAERVALSIVGISVDDAWHGQGQIADVSAKGARIEGVLPQPPLGTDVRLGFFLSVFEVGVDLQRFEVTGAVVRHTQSGGFAVRFRETGDALAKVIDMLVWYGGQLAARVSEPLDFEKAEAGEPE
jgi:hypothetical protein